ncbi:MAG: glycosyltransferase family 39 protein [Alphaproteobacteria bacterium]|nr:glycosyltransferase family 39 protein [Alphaproteobacteria bacterium]
MNRSQGTIGKLDDRQWLTVLVCGLAGLLALRLVALALNRTDLFFDEAQYWFWSLEPDFGYYSKPPLIAWIIGLSTTLCGTNEFCIRLPSPLLHTGTAIAVFFVGRQLYDLRTGVISALVFATLPGVSFSAGIISTDVPLLLFWGIALYAFIRMTETRDWWPALLLGLAFGAGLNAKYAMAWFVVCAVVYIAMTPERRWLARDVRLYAALGLGALMIVPNVLWNLDNKFATLSHTADNAKWGGPLLHPGKALEFFGAQFGVFGPILFGALLVICWRAVRQRLPETDRLLLAFCVPVVVAILIQAFLSRAHANWAAVAYVAAAVLVTATMIRDVAWPWLKASLAIHAVVVVLLLVGMSLAGQIPMPFGAAPFARTLGWQEVAQATEEELAAAKARGEPYAAVLSNDRPVTAELLYYMRANPVPVFAWQERQQPHDHFELVRPFTGEVQGRILWVTQALDGAALREHFESVEKIAEKALPAGSNAKRRVAFFRLSGYKGE